MCVLPVSSLHWFTVCPSSTNKRELERGLDELVLDSIKFVDINIWEFFMTMWHLSNQHGTTFVLMLPDYMQFFSLVQQASSLFVDLGKDFQEIRMKKIVFNIEDCFSDSRPQLCPLAEEVEVYYDSYFYTRAGRLCVHKFYSLAVLLSLI